MQMVRLGLGLAAAVMVAAPAFAADLPAAYPAAPPPSGSPVYSGQSLVTADVSLALGWSGVSGNGLDSDSFAGFAGGRVNIPFGGAWNEELEIAGGGLFNGDAWQTGVFSHTYYKNQSWAAGLLLGYSWSGMSGADTVSVGTAGVEGIVFLPNASVLGKIAWVGGGDAPDDGINVGLGGRYYFEPNTKLTGTIDYFSDGDDSWLFTAGLEHRWSGTPFSAFVTGSYETASSAPDTWGLMIGARFAFDQPGSTLQSHDYEIPFTGTPGLHL
jgi:hypothetical protein